MITLIDEIEFYLQSGKTALWPIIAIISRVERMNGNGRARSADEWTDVYVKRGVYEPRRRCFGYFGKPNITRLVVQQNNWFCRLVSVLLYRHSPPLRSRRHRRTSSFSHSPLLLVSVALYSFTSLFHRFSLFFSSKTRAPDSSRYLAAVWKQIVRFRLFAVARWRSRVD
jgi:hypothetical protein